MINGKNYQNARRRRCCYHNMMHGRRKAKFI